MIALFALALLVTPAAGDVTADFDAANRLYGQGKFTEATAAYEQLIQSGQVSPAIYFNLGNAFFKAGEVGRAIAAYRQAERLAPRDPDIRTNLRFVREKVQDPTVPPGRGQRWLGRLTVNEWTSLAAVALWTCLLSLVLIQLRPGWKSALRGVAIAAGIATVVLGVCLGALLASQSHPTAVVTASDAVVRNGPLDESPIAFAVHDGAELRVLDRKGDWLQVTVGNQRLGWLRADQATIVPPT